MRRRGVAGCGIFLVGTACPSIAFAGEPAPEPYFEDWREGSGIVFHGGPETMAGGGVGIADVDGNGWPDVVLTASFLPALFLNDAGTFTLATDWGLPTLHAGWGATFVDHDNDGDPDLVLPGPGGDKLLEHDGTRFVDRGGGELPDDFDATLSVSASDYDNDGDLDLFFCDAFGPDERAADNLLRNDGDGAFTDVSDLLPTEWLEGTCFNGGWTDIDSDGDPDLYIVNDAVGDGGPGNQMFRNDGPGPDGDPEWVFTRVSASSGTDLYMSAMGLAIGDYDRDGLQDLYVSNTSSDHGEVLLRSLGGGRYEDVTDATGAIAAVGDDRRDSWGVEFIDVDNDGWQDIVLAFGETTQDNPELNQRNAMLLNEEGVYRVVVGSGIEYRDPTADDNTGAARGLAIVDLDLDGCQDVIVSYPIAATGVFRNLCTWGHHWLGLTLTGVETNRDAVGTVAFVTAGGVRHRREVVAGSTSTHASSWKTLHFGLGSAEGVDRIEIHWPSGTADVYGPHAVDQYVAYAEGDSRAFFHGFESGSTLGWGSQVP